MLARTEDECDELGTLLKAIWVRIESEYPRGDFPDMGLFEDRLKYMGVI